MVIITEKEDSMKLLKISVLSVLCLCIALGTVWAGGQQDAATGKSGSQPAGETKAAAAGGDWVIALSNSYYGNTWRKQMVEAFEFAAEKAKAEGKIKDFIVVNGDGTQNQQIAQMNSLILQGVDAIAINSASPTALNGVIEKASKAGIKVLAFDSIATSPECWKLDFDFVRLQQDPSEWVAKKLGGKGNVLIVRGVSGSVPDQQMYQGHMNVINSNPGLKVVGTVIGEASTTVSQQAVSNILPSLPKIDAVFTQGGGDAWGVVQAFEASSQKEMPYIVGDNSAEFLRWWYAKYQKEGYETVSVNSAPGIGGAAFWEALKILEGMNVPKEMSLAAIPVTIDNLADFQDMKPGTIASPVFTEEWVTNFIKEKQ